MRPKSDKHCVQKGRGNAPLSSLKRGQWERGVRFTRYIRVADIGSYYKWPERLTILRETILRLQSAKAQSAGEKKQSIRSILNQK